MNQLCLRSNFNQPIEGNSSRLADRTCEPPPIATTAAGLPPAPAAPAPPAPAAGVLKPGDERRDPGSLFPAAASAAAGFETGELIWLASARGEVGGELAGLPEMFVSTMVECRNRARSSDFTRIGSIPTLFR